LDNGDPTVLVLTILITSYSYCKFSQEYSQIIFNRGHACACRLPKITYVFTAVFGQQSFSYGCVSPLTNILNFIWGERKAEIREGPILTLPNDNKFPDLLLILLLICPHDQNENMQG